MWSASGDQGDRWQHAYVTLAALGLMALLEILEAQLSEHSDIVTIIGIMVGIIE